MNHYTGNKQIAQDLLQETFTRVWFAAHLFDQAGGNFRGWLYTIALNIARSEMSKKRYAYRYFEISEIPHHDEPMNPRSEEPDVQSEHADLKATIARALGKLSPLLREIVILKHYQQLKFKEIDLFCAKPNQPAAHLALPGALLDHSSSWQLRLCCIGIFRRRIFHNPGTGSNSIF
ncbi:MAG: RNA polymerase sigma factor [bacterium]